MTTGKLHGKMATAWKPGQSGNPKGHPQGSRHSVTIALESMLDGEAATLTRKCIEMALAGDMQAMRLCVDRIIPPRKDRPVTVPLPPISTAEEAAQASATILQAVSEGRLTPSEGSDMARLVEGYLKSLEATDLHRRVKALEGRMTIVQPAE